jgi:ribosome-binding factor A
MSSHTRAKRVGELIRRTLADILAREIKDPRLNMTTITHVKMAGDLKSAKIYFMTPEGEKRASEVIAGFKSASGYIKKNLSDELELRYMPTLDFYYDDTLDTSLRIEDLFRSIHNDPHSENG